MRRLWRWFICVTEHREKWKTLQVLHTDFALDGYNGGQLKRIRCEACGREFERYE